jgi:hypothetical protein
MQTYITLVARAGRISWWLALLFLLILMLLLPFCRCCQAGDTLSVSVSLKPTTDMMHRLEKYLVVQPAAGSSAAAAADSAAAEGADADDSNEAEVGIFTLEAANAAMQLLIVLLLKAQMWMTAIRCE